MGYTPIRPEPVTETPSVALSRPPQRIGLHLLLAALTFVSTLMAGAQWVGKNPFEITNWSYGLPYSLLLMLFIASHEFGHYFAARYHKVDVTLPYFIPIPFVFLFPFGTMGAVIKMRSPVQNRNVLFDIGIAGPLAGFVVSVAILIVGFLTLPGVEYIYQIHPEYLTRFGGKIPEWGLYFGDIPLYHWLAALAPEDAFVPPMNEMYHYPFLCVGWFGLFVTALNLVPLGQLDGGHILYGLLGDAHRHIAKILWWAMILLGLGPVFGYLYDVLQHDSPDQLYTWIQTAFLPLLRWIHDTVPFYFQAWSGWLVWALFVRFLIGIAHPPVPDPQPLTPGRKILGWIAILIFFLCVAYNGIYDVPAPPDAVTHWMSGLVQGMVQ